MELQIFISKKGTKVVTACNLHAVLGISNQHYSSNVKKWFCDVYEFRDGIRKPEYMKDYSKRPSNDNLLDDYYLSVELAKMITLNSRSKVKQKFANWLLNLDNKLENAELLTTEQVISVLELAKVMGLVSCQAACEKQHHKIYEERNSGSAANWWNFRSEVLGYSAEQLKKAMQMNGKKANGKSQRQMLMLVDKYEMVRTAVIDLFMALGKSERYAQNLGDLAKVFAKELNIEIFDDRGSFANFAPPLNSELAGEVKNLKNSRYRQLWETPKMAS